MARPSAIKYTLDLTPVEQPVEAIKAPLYSERAIECLALARARGWQDESTITCALEYFSKLPTRMQDEIILMYNKKKSAS
jgi:hypothetical protein